MVRSGNEQKRIDWTEQTELIQLTAGGVILNGRARAALTSLSALLISYSHLLRWFSNLAPRLHSKACEKSTQRSHPVQALPRRGR